MESLGIGRIQGWFNDPNTAGSSWGVLPDDATIRRLIVAHGVAPAGARAFTAEIGGVAVPGLALTGVVGPAEARPAPTFDDAASGFAPPAVYVAKGGAVEIVNDGAGAGTGVAHWTLEFTRGRS